MVERIFARALVVKPVDMCVPAWLHFKDDTLRLAIRVRPLHEVTHADINGVAIRTDYLAHAFTGASTSPLSIRLSAALA